VPTVPVYNPPGVTAGGVWGAWTMTAVTYTGSTGTTVLQATSSVWDTWYTSSTTTYTAMTESTQRADADERAAWLERCRQRDEARAAAYDRSEALFRMVLSPDELAHYVATGEVIVTGSQGNRYRIELGILGNVHLLDDDGQVTAELCCHPGGVPDRDSHAAQVLALRNDEEMFTARANVELRGRLRRQVAA